MDHRRAAVTCALCLLLAIQGRQAEAAQAVQLRDWLDALEVSVPAFPVLNAAAHLGFGVNISGGSCQGLRLEELLLTETVADATHLKIGLQADFGIRCLVLTTLEVGANKSCLVGATSTASVVKLGLQVSIADGLPAHSTVTCQFTPDLTSLEFRTRSIACDALRLAQREIRALLNDFASGMVCPKVSEWLSNSLSEAASELRSMLQPYLQPAAVLPVPASDGAMDLRSIFWKGPVGHVLRSFLREVGHVNDNAQLNKVLAFLRSDLGLGAIVLPAGAEWQVTVPWIENAVFTLAMQSAQLDVSLVEDLHFGFSATTAARLAGSFAPLVNMAAKMALLLPEGTATLKLQGIEINVTQHASLAPVQFQTRAGLQVAGAATMFLAYNRSGMRQLQLDQMQTLGCAATFLDQKTSSPVQLLEARSAPSLRHLDVDLPGHDPEDLETQILKVVLTLGQLLGTAFGNTSVLFMDGLVSRRGRELINTILERKISQPSDCPASNYSSGEIGAIAVPSGWGSGTLLAVMVLLLAVYLWPVCTRRASPPSHPEERFLEAAEVRSASPCPNTSGDSPAAITRGLGWQPGVSPYLRWGILSGIAGTTFLFVYASVTPGILLSGDFNASDGSSETRHMASLSMDNSLAQTWSVGSYFVFCAMLVFSVIWPYVKLFMMLYVWVKPMDPSSRGPMLVFLDQIGKWSLMDNIILFLFIVFFWIAWTGEDLVGGGVASFGLKCSPEDELNTFLAATIMSLLIGHAMLWVHRQRMEKTGEGQQISDAPFRLKVAGGGYVACLFLMVLSWQVEIVDVTFSGLVGTFLKVTSQPTSKRYSMLGILSCLGKQGSTYLQVTFAIFVLVIPLLQLLAMALICLYKLHPQKRQHALRLCYTLKAWAAYDVFLIAFLAAVLGGDRYGIGQFIELIVYKQNLAPTCNAMREVGIECLHIHLGFLPGTLAIVASVTVSYVVSLLAARQTSPG